MARPRPLLALALLAVVTLGPLLDAWAGGSFVGTGPSTLAVVVAGYLTGAWTRPAVAGIACLLGASALAAANQVVQAGRYSATDDLFFFAVLLGATALAGALVTARSAQVRELRRLTDLRTAQRATEVRAAALEERNRVEAEVTASLMQRIGAVVVQASGARVQPDPDAPARIEEAARAALDDLRAAVGSLRTTAVDTDPVDTDVPTAPARPLDRVDVLVGLCGVPVVIEAYAVSGSVLAAVAILVGTPLAWRRTHPLVAISASFAAAVLTSVLVTPLAGLVSPLVPLSVSAYAVGAHARGRSRLAGVAILLVGSAAVALAGLHRVGAGDGVLPVLVWLGLAVLAGVVAAQHTARAARLAQLLGQLEAGRDSDLRLAEAEQRNAVARDLHDTVAHAMTVVCLHAEAAQGSEAVRAQALEVVETAAREAMTQLRAGLEVLETGAPLADDLRALAAALDVAVSVEVADEPAGSTAALVRRVAREALVNAARHAPGAPVTIRVARGSLEVLNPAGQRAAFRGGTGTGLAGLADLVAERGGRLEHGALPDGGYRLVARLDQEVHA